MGRFKELHDAFPISNASQFLMHQRVIDFRHCCVRGVIPALYSGIVPRVKVVKQLINDAIPEIVPIMGLAIGKAMDSLVGVVVEYADIPRKQMFCNVAYATLHHLAHTTDEGTSYDQAVEKMKQLSKIGDDEPAFLVKYARGAVYVIMENAVASGSISQKLLEEYRADSVRAILSHSAPISPIYMGPSSKVPVPDGFVRAVIQCTFTFAESERTRDSFISHFIPKADAVNVDKGRILELFRASENKVMVGYIESIIRSGFDQLSVSLSTDEELHMTLCRIKKE